MNYLAFLGTEDSLSNDLFLGTFFMAFYILFVLPVVVLILLFIYRRKIISNIYKSLAVLTAIVISGILWVLNEPSGNMFAMTLTFILAPLLIVGSLYWYSKLDRNGRYYKIQSSLAVGNAVLLLLIIISNFFA